MAQVILETVYKSFQKGGGSGNAPESATGAIPTTPPASTAQSTAVLRNIHLHIQDGEFMVLVGPSGCGKSTLLRLIAGLEELTGGNIYVGDRLVNTLPPKARDIAMVFQNYALYPHMTVYENLAFGLRRTQRRSTGPQPSLPGWLENLLVSLTGQWPKSWRYRSTRERVIAQQVLEVAQILQIEPLLSRRPKQLSGGQKQRVALGRAMARQPQVFLMDEPLSNLDAKLRAETRSQIVKLQRQLGTTTIYVTHDQTEAMTMGDRITVLNAGQIQQLGTPLELYNHPANRFVAEFIGSPPMNFLEVDLAMDSDQRLQLIHPQFQLPLPMVTLPEYVGRTVVLGIRPEHLQVAEASPQNLPVTVELVEALGNETHVSVDLAGVAMQVRVAPDRPLQVGNPLWLAIAPTKIHLFDLNTGVALL